MSPPLAKRRKRPHVVNSDEEEGSADMGKLVKRDTAKLPPRTRRLPKSELPDEECRTRSPAVGKSMRRQNNGSRPITTFFSATGDIPKPAKRMLLTSGPAAAAQPFVEDEEVEDAIEDSPDNGESKWLMETRDTPRATLDRRKEDDKCNGSPSATSNSAKLPNSSQKFKLIKKANGYGCNVTKNNDVDGRPWAERFAPSNLDELAVHKKKVYDVRSWLESVYSGQHRKKLLILKGPAGVGKTATLKMLAQVMKLEVSEWRNPIGSDYSSEGYISMSAHLNDFLDRTGKFDSLELDGSRKHEYPKPSSHIDTQSIILFEEFPTTFLNISTALQSFRSSVLQYLAVSMPSNGSLFNNAVCPRIIPAIMIITETRLTSTTASSDAFTVHRLLGSDILGHPAVSVIEFNPVAPTFIKKALDLVIQKEARHSGRRKVPGPSVIEKLAEFGDVRSAIGSLEFLCVRAQNHDGWQDRVAANTKSRENARAAVTSIDVDPLEIVTQRENSLGLFHAVGKVVYNKRDDFTLLAAGKSTIGSPIQPPDHLQQHIRRRSPQTSVDKLMDETGTDADTFIAALHENYVISCACSAPIDALDGCLEALSDSDLIGSSQNLRKGLSNATSSTATTESLRQDEIVFHLVVRGLLFALPYPVKRSLHPIGVPGRRGCKDDSHKMFYPVSMRLSRQREEIELLIDHWHKRIGSGTGPGDKAARGASSVTNCNPETHHRMDHQSQVLISSADQEEQGKPLRTSLYCTKAELIVERLPYISKVEQANPFSDRLRTLENMTRFPVIDGLADKPTDDELSDQDTVSATTPTTLQAFRRVGVDVQKEVLGASMPMEQGAGTLYLSDDDIEDT